MLVEGKFIYISIPRAASTSFLISCFRQGLSVNHYDSKYDLDYQLKNYPISLSMTNEELADTIRHCHEPLPALEHKFGTGYEIIAARRNKYERFISSWNHCIDEVIRSGDIETAKILKELDENQILDFDPEHLITKNITSTEQICQIFIDKFNLKSKNEYLTRAFFPVFVPISYYHMNDSRIIWFELDNLKLMEEWVSNKLNLNFKLERSNTSKQIESNLKLTDNFISKYNTIYSRFDNIKTEKTLF